MHFINTQTFFLIEFLFLLQNPFVEKLLKFFIAIVDAKLLITVMFKVLKTSNI